MAFGFVWRQDGTAESTQEVDRILRDDQTSKQVCIPCNHLLFCVSTFSLFKSYTGRVLHLPVMFTMFLEILHHFFKLYDSSSLWALPMLFSNEKVWEAPFWKVPRLFGHCPNSFWPSGGHIGQLVIFSFSRWQLQTFVQGKIQRGGDWTSPARNTCVQKKVEIFFIKKYLFSVPQMVHPPPVLLSGPTARHSLEHMGPHRSHCNISLWLVRFYYSLECTKKKYHLFLVKVLQTCMWHIWSWNLGNLMGAH